MGTVHPGHSFSIVTIHVVVPIRVWLDATVDEPEHVGMNEII